MTSSYVKCFRIATRARSFDQVKIQGVALEEFVPVIETKGDGLRDLRDLKRMRQAISEKVGLNTREYLGLALQAPERRAMEQPRVVAPEGTSVLWL